MKPIFWAGIFLLRFNFFVHAQTTITSVLDMGQFTNPATWDCACVPVSGDNIVVNHHLYFDTDFTLNSGSITINSTGTLDQQLDTRVFTLNGGVLNNAGYFKVGNFNHLAGTINNTYNVIVLNRYFAGPGVTFHNYAWFYVTDSIHIAAGATLANTDAVTETANTVNDGTIIMGGQFISDHVYNRGTLNCNGHGVILYDFHSDGTVLNLKQIVSTTIWNSGTFSNVGSVSYIKANYFWNADTVSGSATFTNGGMLRVTNDLHNQDTINGNGVYCIGGFSENSGTVDGTLTFCDASSFGFDSNTGTITSTVNFCTTPCPPSVVGITDSDEKQKTSVYPNPFDQWVVFKMEVAGEYHLTIYNTMGELVFTESFTGTQFRFDGTALANGLYHYQVGGAASASGTIVK